jgi:uncharacterized 2Fe-2S/4Fe-4S cluster protein (DUF4445 family)
MNEYGRFEDPAPIPLDPANEISFLESDANELAQAKGANVAGLQVIIDAWCQSPSFSGGPQGRAPSFDAIDLFYLAGGFGRHLSVDASKRIGLIPNLPDAKVAQVGNAAIEGATLALLSKTKRKELESLVRRVEHCRLETHPQFFDFFVEGCQFKPVESHPQVTAE